MHGFFVVIVVLLLVNLASAMFSAMNRGAALDAKLAEAVKAHVDGA